MKKKMLLIVPSLQQGGFQRVCVRTALLLKEEFDITIAIFNGEDRAFDVGDIPVVNLDIKSKPGKLDKVINVFKRIQKLKQLKKQLHIDIAYSFGTTANLSNALSKTGEWNWAGLRSYVDVDAFEMKIICRFADKLIACSKVIEEEITKRYSVKDITTVYNPFDIEQLQKDSQEPAEQIAPFSNREDGTIIMTMGREDPLKGYWHLLKSFSIVCKKHDKAKLVFMGRGEFADYIKLAKDLGIDKQVYFLGAKKNPFSYLSKADFYVLSSVHEGFPNALVEAMAVDLPVISTNCKSGPSEILLKQYTDKVETDSMTEAEYGLLVPDMEEQPDFHADHISKEEEILAEAICKYIEDNDTFAHFKQKAKERCLDFSTRRYIDALVVLANGARK